MKFEEALVEMRSNPNKVYAAGSDDTRMWMTESGLLCSSAPITTLVLSQHNWGPVIDPVKVNLNAMNNGYEFQWGERNLYIVQDQTGKYFKSTTSSAKVMDALYFPVTMEGEIDALVSNLNSGLAELMQ